MDLQWFLLLLKSTECMKNSLTGHVLIINSRFLIVIAKRTDPGVHLDLEELTAQVIRFTWMRGFMCLDNLNSCSRLILCSIQLPVNEVKR